MAYKYLNDNGLKALVKKIKAYIASLLPTKSVTYAELKALRDADGLLVGRKYRITDYVTTTTQTDTRSAGHVFDIIVVADDESTLNENARAILHNGDTYFKNCKLNAWELKYCLDNDTTRFAWADATNGKGVVWWMKDEWDNKCYYDFKNIQYKRWKVTGATETKYNTKIEPFIFSDAQPYFYGIKDAITGNIYPEYSVIVEDAFDWFYTFAARVNAGYSDASLKEHLTEDEKTQIQGYGASDNSVVSNCVIGKNTNRYYSDGYYSSDVLVLNNAVVYNEIEIDVSEGEINGVIGGYAYGIRFGNNCSSWTCGNDCYSNTFGNDCSYNTLGNDCSSNTLGDDCKYNTFGNDCSYNTFGDTCYSNTFGDHCQSNTFGVYCQFNTFETTCLANTFGNDCSSNTLVGNCSSNTFGNDCYSNTFGDGCRYNTFGNHCQSNTFGDTCYSNTFENACLANTFGNHCWSNTFENNCSSNTFGDDCSSNTFGNDCSSNTFGNNLKTSVIGDGVRYIKIPSATSGDIQFCEVYNGTQGTNDSQKLVINFEPNKKISQHAGLNSSGILKIFVPLDLIN